MKIIALRKNAYNNTCIGENNIDNNTTVCTRRNIKDSGKYKDSGRLKFFFLSQPLYQIF